jgi:hypothetical protein
MNSIDHTVFPFTPDRSLDIPTGCDIDAIDGIDKHTGYRVSTMSDGVGLQISWDGFIPLAGFNRDMFTENTSRLSGRESQFIESGSHGFHQSVNGSRRDVQDILFDTFREMEREKG